MPGVAITGETPCPPDDGSAERTITFEQPPPMCIDETKSYTAEIETNVGSMTVELDATKAPNTVNNFVVLARYHYFDGIVCHRAIPGFVVQCGDPDGTGSGGPGYEFGDELPGEGEYVIGSLAMANSGPNTNGSQFFIITGDDRAPRCPPTTRCSARSPRASTPRSRSSTRSATPTRRRTVCRRSGSSRSPA